MTAEDWHTSGLWYMKIDEDILAIEHFAEAWRQYDHEPSRIQIRMIICNRCEYYHSVVDMLMDQIKG